MDQPPWVFRYSEDPADAGTSKLGRPPALRPIVAARLHALEASPRAAALVDSGSERTLAAPGLARAIGVDLSTSDEMVLGVGGGWRTVRFANVNIQLYLDLLDDDAPFLAEWEAEVGFVNNWDPPWPVLLGQTGFFDQFTVTMQRLIPAFAIEPRGVFRERFKDAIVQSKQITQPRFKF